MRRLLAATLALFALALAAAPGAEARVAPEFVGLVSESIVDETPAARGATLDAQAASGSGLLRQVFDWARVERTRGTYDLSVYDDLVAGAARRGIRIMPLLFNPPRFRSSRPARGARRGTYPPRHPADMGQFASILARRYGPRGTLWAENPGLRVRPIRSWQVWNEPNIPVFWPSGPSPRAYTRLLRAVGRSIKAVDPRAEILTAGLPQTRIGVDFERFVNGMYRAGGRRAFDTLAINPYSRDVRGVLAGVRTARRLMNRRRDRGAKLWVTEIGWATSGPRSAFRAGERGQARRVRALLPALARRRRSLKLRGVVYYRWRDLPRPAGQRDFFGFHTGLMARDGRRKRGFTAFRDAARSLR